MVIDYQAMRVVKVSGLSGFWLQSLLLFSDFRPFHSLTRPVAGRLPGRGEETDLDMEGEMVRDRDLRLCGNFLASWVTIAVWRQARGLAACSLVVSAS